MFKNLFVLDINRTKLQAFGFYIVYVILGLAISGLVCGALARILLGNSNDVQAGIQIGLKYGAMIASLYALISGLWIIFSKKIFTNIGALIFLIIGTLCSYLFGAILGYIFIAALTTFESKRETCENPQDDK